MKSYSSFILDRLASDSATVFLVIDITIPSAKRWTTLPYNVTIGGQTYLGKAGLVTFDMPRSDQALGRDSYKITVSDPDRTLEGELTQAGTGAPFSIRLGFFNTSSQPVLTDLVTIYKGSIDTYVFSQEEETRTLSIQGVSPAGALSYGRAIFTDKDYIKQQNNLDTSMDLVGTTSLEKLILGWGKAP
jgi:hypothetical protein